MDNSFASPAMVARRHLRNVHRRAPDARAVMEVVSVFNATSSLLLANDRAAISLAWQIAQRNGLEGHTHNGTLKKNKRLYVKRD